MKQAVNIFVSCKKPCILPQSEIFIPIQTGAAKAKTHYAMLQDDEGENISEKNEMYCELTAQYWVWKHVKSDYYGFCHYRRFFSFSDEKIEEDMYGTYWHDVLNESLQKKLCMSSERIQERVSQYDIIVANSSDIKSLGYTDLYSQYAQSPELHVEDLKCAISVLKEFYPQYSQSADEYMKGRFFYPCNMFIMKKDLFMEYCEWLFNILEETERRCDWTNYSIEGKRTLGHIAERLLGVFYTQKKKEKYKTAPFQWIILRYTEPITVLEPAYTENNIPIVMCFSDYFVPYASVTIQSMLENAKKQNNYDIIVLHTSVSDDNQKRLQWMVNKYNNATIRFLNIIELTSELTWKANNHISVESFYRLNIARLLPRYNKVIYLDSDLLVLRDIADIYEIDLSGLLIAATVDADHAGQCGGVIPKVKEYTEEILGLANPYDYFQAGVVIFNVEEFRKQFEDDELLEYAQEREYMYMDQDVLNAKCTGQICYLPMNWNVLTDCGSNRVNNLIRKAAPWQIYEDYMEARKNPFIIHYAGWEKPWDNPDSDFSFNFWSYARRNPFYETIIFRAYSHFDTSRGKGQSTLRMIADIAFPKGTHRRETVKKIYKFLSVRLRNI